MKLSDENRRILISSLHEMMDKYSTHNASSFITGSSEIKPASTEEQKAFQLIQGNKDIASLLQRLLWFHGKSLMFDLFCLIDGVGDPDPKLGNWTEVLLIDKPEGFNEHYEFLHDEL